MNGKLSISSRLACALLATLFLAAANDSAVHAQTLPQILTARLQGKKLIVTGQDFSLGAKIVIDGRQEKTKNSADNPTGELIVKKGLKRVEDRIVTIHVINPAGPPSSGFRFFGGLTITLADQGKTINLAVGQQFLVNLAGGYAWQVDFERLTNIVAVPVLFPILGAQGLFQPVAPGRVSFKAKGEPDCSRVEPKCTQGPIEFEVTISIE